MAADLDVEAKDYFSGHFLFRELGYTDRLKLASRYPLI
jgi:hypothetical protein